MLVCVCYPGWRVFRTSHTCIYPFPTFPTSFLYVYYFGSRVFRTSHICIFLRWPVSAIVKVKIKVCLACEKRCCPKFFIQHQKMLLGGIHYGSKIITTDPTFCLWMQRFNSGSKVLTLAPTF